MVGETCQFGSCKITRMPKVEPLVDPCNPHIRIESDRGNTYYYPGDTGWIDIFDLRTGTVIRVSFV